MVIRRAKTEGEIKEVSEYLSKKGTTAGRGDLYYCLGDNGEIVGAYCAEVKVCIDPLQAESPVIAVQLMADGLAVAREHTDRVYVLTKEDKVRRALTDHYGAELWTKGADEYVIFYNK